MNEFFFDYFADRLKFIEVNCLNRINRIEGLILMCCYLDSLAGYRYGGKSSYKRFRIFILEYSGYGKIWTKISLPLLKRHFENGNKQIYADFLSKLGVRDYSYTQKGYNVDVDANLLENQARNKIFTPFSDQLKEELNKYEYVRILWKEYRNSAVHETSTYRDEAQNFWNDKQEPFYAHANITDDGGLAKEEIKFAIPNVFILGTLKNCINNFAKYTEKSNINIFEAKKG